MKYNKDVDEYWKLFITNLYFNYIKKHNLNPKLTDLKNIFHDIGNSDTEITPDIFIYGLKYFSGSKNLKAVADKKFPNININPNYSFEDYKEQFPSYEEDYTYYIESYFKDIEDLNAKSVINVNSKNELANKGLTSDFDKSHGIFKIAKSQWESVLKQLERCKNLMGENFTYKIIGEDEVQQKHNDYIGDNHGGFTDIWLGDKIPVYKVEINCNVQENNWVVCAIINHVQGQDGVSIFEINKDYSIPEKYFSEKNISCDHCHTNRDRTQGFIVYNTQTKEYRQVGKSCLKEYTGINPTGLLALYNVYNTVNHTYIDTGSNGSPKYFSTKDILEIAVGVTDCFGYKKADPSIFGSTKELISFIYYPNSFMEDDINRLTPYADKVAHYIKNNRNDILKKVNDIIEFFKDYSVDNNSFMLNVKTALSGPVISVKQLGIIACVPFTYSKLVNQKDTDNSTNNSTDNSNNDYNSTVILMNASPEDNDNIKFLNQKEYNSAYHHSSNSLDFWSIYRYEIEIPKDAIYKIDIGQNKTKYGSYPVKIWVKGNDHDNNKCGAITTFIENNDIDTKDITKITGIANDIYDPYGSNTSLKLKNPTFWTKSSEDKTNSNIEYKVGDKISIDVDSVDISRVYSGGYDDYAYVNITDKDGIKYSWACNKEDIYTGRTPLKGKTLKATIKGINYNQNGSLKSYAINRGKIQETRNNNTVLCNYPLKGLSESFYMIENLALRLNESVESERAENTKANITAGVTKALRIAMRTIKNANTFKLTENSFCLVEYELFEVLLTYNDIKQKAENKEEAWTEIIGKCEDIIQTAFSEIKDIVADALMKGIYVYHLWDRNNNNIVNPKEIEFYNYLYNYLPIYIKIKRTHKTDFITNLRLAGNVYA